MQEWELTLSLRQVVCNLLVEVKIFHQRCHQKLLSYANFYGNMKTDVGKFDKSNIAYRIITKSGFIFFPPLRGAEKEFQEVCLPAPSSGC